MVEHSRVDHVSAAFIAYSVNRVLRRTELYHAILYPISSDEFLFFFH
jgi:hypothetical protein